MSNRAADQTDILAQLEQLNVELNTAKATINTLQTQVTTLTSERDSARQNSATLQASLSTVTQERDTLKAESDKLKSEKEDFSKRLAAELAKHGVRTVNQNASPQGAVAERKLTATERLLAAKGVKSVAELAKK